MIINCFKCEKNIDKDSDDVYATTFKVFGTMYISYIDYGGSLHVNETRLHIMCRGFMYSAMWRYCFI